MYLPDFARSLVVLGTHEEANGKMWILPHSEIMTIKQFVERFYDEAGITIPEKIKARPLAVLNLIGLFNKDVKEYAKMNYQRKADWVVDDSLFRNTFLDWKSTDFHKACIQTLAYYNKK